MYPVKLIPGLLVILSLFSSYSCQETKWSIRDEFHNGNYVATRNVDLDAKSIQFQVEVETLGFVGFGISSNGGMAGADIVIGGVFDNGTTYFGDYHAVDRQPILDEHQNWISESITQNETHTLMTFKRAFVTCDDQDIEITEDTLHIIWSFGSTDEIDYHGNVDRGTQSKNLLDPPMPVKDVSSFMKWEVVVEDTMPAVDTAYICTIHEMPTLTKTHHIIGFDALLRNEEAFTHTHHLILHKCNNIPPEHLQHFKDSVGTSGEDCSDANGRNDLWIEYCQMNLFVWSKGGEITTFPENVGFPIAEKPDETEFFMLEIHYDNPKLAADSKFETGMQIYYTDVLRPETAGVMVIGHSVSWSHTIPPNAASFMTVGHCSPLCLTEGLADTPDGSINIFNVLLHSHLSGRQLKLRHFRGDEELPWPSVDMNYNFDYQQNRHLKEERKVLKGDHLTYECITSTEWKKGEIVTGGLSTRDEMCEAFVMYYPKVEMVSCASQYPREDLMKDFGIEIAEAELLRGPLKIPIVISPENWRGRNYTDVVTNAVQWTDELRLSYQANVVNKEHDIRCSSDTNPDFGVTGKVKYPNVKEYQRENECDEIITTTTESADTTTTTESADTTTTTESADTTTTTESADTTTTTESADTTTTTESADTTTTTESGNRTTTPDSRSTTASAGKISGLSMILFVILGALCVFN